MVTPHIEAPDGAFAPLVLMPGDPKRSAWIAETFLTDVDMVTNVRNMSGFTGTWEGSPVSVMASGMGMPSASIYITELIREYGVSTLIRIGTAGAYQPHIPIRQLVAASGATTNSVIPEILAGGPIELRGDAGLLSAAEEHAATMGLSLAVGNVFTSDLFYEPTNDSHDAQTAAGTLCVEMETAALYAIAQLEGQRALSLLTMSDHLATGDRLSSDERQSSLHEMVELALRVGTAD